MAAAEDKTRPGELRHPIAEDAETPVAPATQSGWVRREPGAENELPTRHMDSGIAAYASRIDEIRRLYAEGSTDEALLLASTVSPPSQLGWSLAAIPVLLKSETEILELPLDHRAGFVLAHVDGVSTLETLIDVVPLPESEVLALVESLVAEGVIRLAPPEQTVLRRTPR